MEPPEADLRRNAQDWGGGAPDQAPGRLLFLENPLIPAHFDSFEYGRSWVVGVKWWMVSRVLGGISVVLADWRAEMEGGCPVWIRAIRLVNDQVVKW